ncbi:aminotransferase class I/II-fold pyridoxal phosphate-dependent enzyme [Sporosarcina sp. FA9]|uniref:aminotransferase class I/II-fold pyridoxal phosphate-dependent enzyme n=1 Tax=Sporosarcina sp. FA9 TaxID=3413030 RepID=UPI003F655F09
MMKNIFGQEIDIEVGYARGEILKNSFSEKMKQQNAVAMIEERVKNIGEESLFIFTGNVRNNQLKKEDLGILSEEWVGPSLFFPALKEKALLHFSSKDKNDDVAIFNRTSAAIVSSILALVNPGQDVISYAPNKKAHPSVVRGAKLANARFTEVGSIEELKDTQFSDDSICVITGVTSELLLLNTEDFVKAIQIAKSRGFTVIIDDAYGARIRTILLNQASALEIGADIVITNNDKAGLHGPRAGILAGKKELVVKISAKASEYGMEARAPIALGVLRSLEKFNSNDLIEEQHVGNLLYEGLSQKLGEEKVRKTLLGPEISGENTLKYLLDRRSLSIEKCSIVPAEATAAIGFILLRKYGIITTNTCGMPGARVSLRLKTNKETIESFGGVNKVIEAVLDSFNIVANIIDDSEKIRDLIIG